MTTFDWVRKVAEMKTTEEILPEDRQTGEDIDTLDWIIAEARKSVASDVQPNDGMCAADFSFRLRKGTEVREISGEIVAPVMALIDTAISAIEDAYTVAGWTVEPEDVLGPLQTEGE